MKYYLNGCDNRPVSTGQYYSLTKLESSIHKTNVYRGSKASDGLHLQDGALQLLSVGQPEK